MILTGLVGQAASWEKTVKGAKAIGKVTASMEILDRKFIGISGFEGCSRALIFVHSALRMILDASEKLSIGTLRSGVKTGHSHSVKPPFF
jgi:hypothetical protein